jgi:Flp pilus assembly protein TadD
LTPEDRQFWLEFRRGILQINLALERKIKTVTPEDRSFWLEFRQGVIQANLALEQVLNVGRYEPAEKSLGPAYLNSDRETTAPRGRRT